MLPDKAGHFGIYGGRFVPETLMPALIELDKNYQIYKRDKSFKEELEFYLKEYTGRPTPLYFCRRLTERLKGARVYLKREDLTHTGAHKINNTLGQVLLAKKMGKTRVIAETGAGQHGVATATAAALLGLECEVYMGVEDVRRQAMNVFRMKLLGATVKPVEQGSQTLKDAINEGIRDWVTNVADTYYVMGTVAGPHPYPMMVRDFQAVIGREARQQILKKENRLPDAVIACIGGGSNAMGIFHAFRNDPVKFIGVEAAGEGISSGKHSATLCVGSPGVLHGAMSYLLQTKDGQILDTHSIAAGLDYPGIGPEHAHFKDTHRAEYVSVTDEEALAGFKLLAETEGILPALESSHAVAYASKFIPKLSSKKIVIINLSGRGDKDVQTVASALGGAE